MAYQNTNFSLGLKLLALAFFLGAVLTFILFSTAILSVFSLILSGFFCLLGIATVIYCYAHPLVDVDPVPQKIEKLCDETDEEFQNRMQTDNAIKQFSSYAKGEISLDEITVDPNSDLYQWLFHSQKAYFSLTLQAEIDRNEETEGEKQAFKQRLQNKVMGSLEKSETSYEKLPRTNEKEVKKTIENNIENNRVIFNRLFERVEELSPIKRPIYRTEDGIPGSANIVFKRRKKFVLFASNPDGNCYFYSINVKTREKMFDLIAEHLEFGRLKFYIYKRIFEAKLKAIALDYAEVDTELYGLVAQFAPAKAKRDTLVLNKKPVPQDLHQAAIDTLYSQLDKKIKHLIDYENNAQFVIFMKKYIQDLWFDNFIIDELSNAMYFKNPKNTRKTANFSVTKKNLLELKYAWNGCYRFVGKKINENDSDNIENDILYIWCENAFFYYQFKAIDGRYINNKIEMVKLKEHFDTINSEEIATTDLDFDSFISQLISNKLEENDKFFAEFLLFSTIAEKEDSGPQFYFYNYFCDGIHVSRFVELEDDEELVRAKIHENRFELCQDQAAYNAYEKNWVKPVRM